MEDTIPWSPTNARNGVAKCYCHDYFKCEDSGDYLFVLWKSDTDSAGTIWGAAARSETGQSQVVEHTDSYKGGRVIWGRPCYYWIIPRLRTVVSIKLDHSVCDSGLFKEWVSKCITNKIKHKNKKKLETPTGRIKFEFMDSPSLSSTKYSYRFDIRLKTLNTGNAQLQELASRITHIIKRDTIDLTTVLDERPKWIKFFDGIPHLSVKPKAKTRQIEIRAEAKPSVQEIKEIIAKFAREERTSRDWNNVGFETDTGVDVWVDKYRLHETINFSKKNSMIFSAKEVYERLNERRVNLLKLIESQENCSQARSASGGGI